MKVLFDTNVVLDIALNRRPFVEDASLLLRLAEQKEITACLSNTCITDIFYLINKHAEGTGFYCRHSGHVQACGY